MTDQSHVTTSPDPITVIKARIAEREVAVQNLQPQIARTEQFASELRGKLFQAQAQHAELTDLLKTIDPTATDDAN